MFRSLRVLPLFALFSAMPAAAAPIGPAEGAGGCWLHPAATVDGGCAAEVAEALPGVTPPWDDVSADLPGGWLPLAEADATAVALALAVLGRDVPATPMAVMPRGGEMLSVADGRAGSGRLARVGLPEGLPVMVLAITARRGFRPVTPED